MSSTTVHSKSSIAASQIYLTENTLEVPKDAKKVHEIVTTYIEEQGSLEISAGNAAVKENGEMMVQDGTILMVAPEAIKALAKHVKEKGEKEKKLAEIKAKEEKAREEAQATR